MWFFSMKTVELNLGVCFLLVAVVFISGCFDNQAGVVHGVIQINGSGLSRNFSRYYVEHGSGLNPSNWSVSGVNLTGNGTSQVNESVLASWDTSSVADGYHTIRLIVVSRDNISSQDLLFVFVDNILLTSPVDGATIYANESVNISGGAAGPDFQSYVLEYSLTQLPYNWSRDGITLTANGSSPVIYSLLGSWNTSFLDPGREYLLRLSVNDSVGFIGGDNVTVEVAIQCVNITENTTFESNLTGYNACVIIESDNVTLDCAGYSLIGGGIDWDYGIILNGTTNVTVKNCSIQGYRYGIYLDNASESDLSNNTLSYDISYGIYLSDSDYNTLSSNTVSNSTFDGIYLTSSRHNSLIGNSVRNNRYYGIYFYKSGDNVVGNNTVSNNSDYGIYIYSSSDYNNLTDNAVVNNGNHGIYVRSSEGNVLVSNIVSNNSGYGVYLSSTENTSLFGTVMENQGVYISGFSMSQFKSHTIDVNNTVNGKPVQYILDASNSTVPVGAGQVILVNATNVTVSNQNVSNGSVGIEVAYSSGCTIVNNTADYNRYGIYLYQADNNTLYGNSFSNNEVSGINLESSEYNTLTNNTINLSARHGLYVDGLSPGNTLTNNVLCGNNRVGGNYYDIYDADSTTGDNNTCNTIYGYNDASASSGCKNTCYQELSTNLVTGWNLIGIPFIL